MGTLRPHRLLAGRIKGTTGRPQEGDLLTCRLRVDDASKCGGVSRSSTQPLAREQKRAGETQRLATTLTDARLGLTVLSPQRLLEMQ